MFFGRRKKKKCGELDILLLDTATAAGDLAEVKRLVIDCGVDPNILSELRFTSLFIALSSGHPEVVEFLLEHGADPNIKNNDGSTPLHYAADNSKVVEVLLEHGADLNIRDKYGATPLHDAAENGHPEVVELLLEHGADPNIQNNMA